MGVAVLEMSNGCEYKKGSENLSLFESLSRFAPCKGIRNPWKFCLWNPKSEQICTCTIWNPGHWNPEYKFRWQQIRNQVPENRNPWHRIKKPRLSWIPSHGRRLIKPKKVVSTEWKAAKVRYHMRVYNFVKYTLFTCLSVPFKSTQASTGPIPTKNLFAVTSGNESSSEAIQFCTLLYPCWSSPLQEHDFSTVYKECVAQLQNFLKIQNKLLDSPRNMSWPANEIFEILHQIPGCI